MEYTLPAWSKTGRYDPVRLLVPAADTSDPVFAYFSRNTPLLGEDEFVTLVLLLVNVTALAALINLIDILSFASHCNLLGTLLSFIPVNLSYQIRSPVGLNFAISPEAVIAVPNRLMALVL